MAKKVVLLVLAMLMVLSSCTAVVFGAERVYLYKQDFEHFETGIHHENGGMKIMCQGDGLTLFK